jgi:hypothetical protein
MKRLIIIAIAVTALSAPITLAQSETRIQFPAGRDTMTLTGTIRDTAKHYVLRGNAGQRLTVNLSSPNHYVHLRIHSDGVEDPLQNDGTRYLGISDYFLPQDGDYHVYVLCDDRGTASFTLDVKLRPAGILAEDFEGYFELVGKAPRGLAGFEGIEMTTVEFRPNGSVPVKPRGNVRAHGSYRMATIAINGADLSFETVAVRGVSYQFSGTLSRNKSNDPGAVALILKGHLTKSLNGRKVAEADVRLQSVEGVD